MRGRDAGSPTQIPASGWRDVFIRAFRRIGQDRLTLTAAGVAFYGLLAAFPLIAAAIALWGLAASPEQLASAMHDAYETMPPQAASILDDQASRIVADEGGGTTTAAILGLLVSFYLGSRGVSALIEGLNIASNEREKRGFIKTNLVAILLTVGLILGALVAVALVAVAPAVLGSLPIGDAANVAIRVLRWPVLFIGALAALAVIYRFGPSRAKPRLQWVTPGALFAALAWLLASAGFSIYVANFADYNATYGALGGVVILLMWIWLSALVVLIGQEINVEAERQTRRDSTVAPDKPIGERGAWAADTLGPTP